MALSSGKDPLSYLPSEIVLRILDFVPVKSIAAAIRLSRAWREFIDETHQDAIYSHPDKTNHPEGSRDLSAASHALSFARYFDNVLSWKDLCKRQTLLARNWDAERPVTRESILQVGNSHTWRFRADFKRRFFLSTSQSGGLSVIDMDTGKLLWCLSTNLVRPCAHLEYHDGIAVFDREGDALEVWRTDLGGMSRGVFQQIAILSHDCQTRGFQLSHDNLCVVSDQGEGFVYDMLQEPPKLKTHIEIESDAVGHLAQNEDVVMYSMGTGGYHFYDKSSATFLGSLQPSQAEKHHHINHPPRLPAKYAKTARHGQTDTIFPPSAPSQERLVPIQVLPGPFDRTEDSQRAQVDADEWGAGLLAGSLMVGVSRGGRVFVCSDWRGSLKSSITRKLCSSLIEVEGNRDNFDLGGWLSMRKDLCRATVPPHVHPTPVRPAQRRRSGFQSALMALFDDCIMTTYTTLGRRQYDETRLDDQPLGVDFRPLAFPTKAIRILSLAPELAGVPEPAPQLWRRPPESLEIQRAHADLLRVISIMGNGPNNDDVSDEDETVTIQGPT